MTKVEVETYKKFVSEQLSQLTPLLQKYALGDFSKEIEIPEEENEFTELFVGLRLMVDDVKELMKEKETTIRKLKMTDAQLKKHQENLEELVEERTLKMEKSQSLLNATGNMAKVGGWELNLSTNKLYWTEEVYHIHELDSDYKLVVEETIKFYTNDSRPIIKNAIQNAKSKGKPFDLELQIKTANGKVRWIHTIAKVEKHNGKVIRIWGTFQDIHERKETKEQLKYEKDFKSLLQSITTGFINLPVEKIDRGIKNGLKEIANFVGAVRASVFLLNDDLTSITNTHEWCKNKDDSQIKLLRNIPFEAFGYYRELLLKQQDVIVGSIEDLPEDKARGEREWINKYGFRSLLFVPMILGGNLYGTIGFYGKIGEPKDWPKKYSSLMKIVQTIFVNVLERKKISLELIDYKNHLEEQVERRTAKLKNSNKKLKREIIERKQAEEALRESDEKFRGMVMNLMEGFYSVTFDGKLIDYNTEFTRILGLVPNKNYSGLDLPDFWQNPGDREDYLNEFRKKGLIKNYEVKAKKSDGEKIVVQVNSQLIKDKKGQPIKIEGTFLDITERKKIETERERLNRELIIKNKELEQVLYATSHDLRSPLVNIQGFNKELHSSIQELETILKSEDVSPSVMEKCKPILEEDIPESLHYIISSSSKMDSLLSGLLTLSRVGRQLITIKKLDMANLVNDVLANFKSEINQKNVTLNVSELSSCHGDQPLINQVFSNLLGNALKFLDPDRAGVLKIYGRKEKDYNVYVVEDNGIGISQKHQKKIFEIFHQLDPFQPGVGLGLNIIKQILDKHHGFIQVDSKVGQSTKFTVALPLRK
jgi:two-component system, cell cycle sensor histidine kinase PleC